MKSFKISNDDANDLLSAITVWERFLDHKQNPETSKALVRLKKRLWKFIREQSK